ncbi:MAG: DUF790 family protein, partial [Ktedonobacterales bacterium]
AALIALHEEWTGRARADFPADRPAELIGDYRLGRSLTACLAEWYAWEPRLWPGDASAAEAEALAHRGIASPVQLRLALYDAVNDGGAGYLAADRREAALDAFAASLGIMRTTLDALLVLDRDERAVLRRLADAPPRPAALAIRYNQLALEALLATASSVEWILPAELGSSGANATLSAAVKRVCFLARRMGVYYDLAFEQAAASAPAATLSAFPEPPALQRVAERPALYSVTPRTLHITLYGPQEVTGAANQYGERLARLCRALLGYHPAPDAAAQPGLGDGGARGSARVYLHGRPLTFLLDDTLLALLAPEVSGEAVAPAGAEQFDSALEEHLYAALTSLERAGEAHGWHVEREPEPMVEGETIYLPDFSLTRGAQRVYLELAGYWRPEYRERKVRKLLALRGRLPLVVALPASAAGEFAALEGVYPLLTYGARPSPHALLALLDRAYDDSAARLAAVDAAAILARLDAGGRLPPAQAMEAFAAHTRAQRAAALALLEAASAEAGRDAPSWIDGLGLCPAGWRDALLAGVRAHVSFAPRGRLPFAALRALLLQDDDTLGELTDDTLETLLRLAGLAVARDSIFAAEAVAPEALEPEMAAPEVREGHDVAAPTFVSRRSRRAQPTRTPQRKVHDVAYAPQSLLSTEQPGSADRDASGPNES